MDGPDGDAGGTQLIDPLGPDSTVDDLVATVFADAVDELITWDTTVLSTDDPEAVHRARVAVRSLRSHLLTLRPVIDQGAVAATRGELRWLGRELGAARDLDVLADRLGSLLDEPPGGSTSSGTQRLMERLVRSEREARDAARAALRSERYRVLLASLVAASARPPITASTDPAMPAAEAVRPLARRAWKRVARPLRGLDVRDAPDEVLHEVRKRAKRARYAAELAARVVPDASPGFADEMRRYQDALGALQDAVTTQAWLTSAAREVPESAFVAGAAWARIDLDRTSARRDFVRRWDPRRARRRARWFR